LERKKSGNLTGVTSLNVELGSKRLELLHELVPTAKTNSALAEALTRDVQAAGGRLGLQIHVLHAGTERELDTVFATQPAGL
jgi:putative ABC transport system substrate-binding protein